MKMREEAQKKYEEAKQTGDWEIEDKAERRLKIIERVLELWTEQRMKNDRSKALILPAIVEALKNNLEDNPRELLRFMLTYALNTTRKALEDIPQPHKLLEEHKDYRLYGMFNPAGILSNLGTFFAIIHSRTFGKEKEEWEKYKNILDKIQHEYWNIGLEELHKNPKIIIEAAKNKLAELLGETLIEEWDEKPEEPLAPKLIATIHEERLPGAAYRLATILHAVEQGNLPPQALEKIIEATTAPHSPQGTQLYNLIYKIIDRLEEATAKATTPPKPSQIIEEILREAMKLKPYHNPEQTLREITEGKRTAEALLLKKYLGAPGDKRRLAKTLLKLLRIAREIEQGKRDPYHEDVRSELATIARNLPVEPRTPTPEYLQRINPTTLEYLHNTLHREYTEKAIQLGRETALRLLSKALQIAKEEIGKHRGKPYPIMVAEVARAVEERLKREMGEKPTPEERQDARWASLAIQFTLQALPIHVAENREELGMAKALLTQGYNPKEYDTPLFLDALGRMAKLGEYNREEAKNMIEMIRQAAQTAEVVKNVGWRTLQAHREEGTLDHRELTRNITENIRAVSRVRREQAKR